ncbi:hypothetical protein M426DRAFT_185241 [Hypoxylon sp. CI-4A]|nr:hypothetical protein M426DRAFT_185241 [Hypoxylon sp. CI-4A]
MADSTGEQQAPFPAQLKKPSKTPKEALQNHTVDESILDLLDPGYRKAPADVQRRAERTVRAEPPPPPPTQTRFPTRRGRSERGKKQSNGFDGDSGSDSDEKSKRGHGEDDILIVRRKPTQQSAVDNPRPTSGASPARTLLTPEEEERVRLRRALNDGSLGSVLKNWKSSMINAAKKKQKFVSDDSPKDSLSASLEYPPDIEVIRQKQKRLDDYLNESLPYDLEEAPRNNSTSQNLAWEERWLRNLVEQIEADFVLRWEKTLQQGFSSSILRRGHQLKNIVRAIHRILTNPNCWSRSSPFYMAFTPSDLTSDTFSWDTLGDRGRGFRFDSLATPYEREIIRDLSKNVLQSRGASKTTPPVLASIEASCSWGEPLDSTYVDWIYSLVPRGVIDECCQQMCQQTQLLELSISQVFYETYNGNVEFVSFKGNFPASMRRMAQEDLGAFGWFRDEHNGGKYSRYEFDYGFQRAFKVAVDGKVLGMVEGDSVVYLEN